MIGNHCIKTWSATQGAYAMSSAEAELHAMVEAVMRSKGLVTLAKEVGINNLSPVIKLGTDSNAAKSFVCRKGLGKMRHLEIKDLWLQKEVSEFTGFNTVLKQKTKRGELLTLNYFIIF